MSTSRIVGAALTVLLYASLCAVMVWRHRRRVRQAAQQVESLLPATPGQSVWWVCHASQTGQAEAVAVQTAQLLHQAGLPVRLLPLGQLDGARLQQIDRLLCIVSTYGEGDSPDSAAPFVSGVMPQTALDLPHLHVGLLALGDSSYTHYCGFGHALGDWFAARGAQFLFDRIAVDRGDAQALRHWHRQLAHVAGTSDLPDWEAPALQTWRLQSRRHLNPGSLGGAVHHLVLVPDEGLPLPDWEAGDLVQLEVPLAVGVSRDYSIASVPQDGAIHLLVRQTQRDDGQPGIASGWLTHTSQPGDAVMLRVRPHAGFRIQGNAHRSLILIGNGTGLAGLRGHMRARLAMGGRLHDTVLPPRPESVAPMWLLFGERQAHCDAHCRDEIDDWARQGWLHRVDWVFSRDGETRRYVQHALTDAADALRAWVAQDAAIYVCGSLDGMAGEVDMALRAILGYEALDLLALEGRYRRDVY